MTADPILATLLHPFATGALAWPAKGGVLFLRARAGAEFPESMRAGLRCQQSFKPFADALSSAGFSTVDVDPGERFPVVLLLPPRQREEARALLARALRQVLPGGLVLACMANSEGARSGEADMRRLAGVINSESKNHCRVFWTRADAAAMDADLITQWSNLDAPRLIADGRFLSRPGLFAWDRIDAASALLVAHLPSDLNGHGADLGAGYGYLSAEVLARCPRVTGMDLYEAEARALDLAKENLRRESQDRRSNFFWHDVCTGLLGRYDFIVSNPPFHQGRADQPELGRAFIAAAVVALNPGGCLWLVANRHLPYESTLREGFASVRVIAETNGFKVIEAIKSGTATGTRA